MTPERRRGVTTFHHVPAGEEVREDGISMEPMSAFWSPKRAVPAQLEAPQPSVIGRNLRIRGNLKSAGEIRIDGIIEGDVEAPTIIVGEKASITGNVVADTIDVHGFVQGDISAGIVKLTATAHVIGDTTHEEISVEKGACLDGNYRRKPSRD